MHLLLITFSKCSAHGGVHRLSITVCLGYITMSSLHSTTRFSFLCSCCWCHADSVIHSSHWRGRGRNKITPIPRSEDGNQWLRIKPLPSTSDNGTLFLDSVSFWITQARAAHMDSRTVGHLFLIMMMVMMMMMMSPELRHFATVEKSNYNK